MTDKKHSLPITPVEIETLKLLNAPDKQVALMPVFFNGEERFGIVSIGTSSSGRYMRLLAVLTRPEDVVLDREGQPPVLGSPDFRKQLN